MKIKQWYYTKLACLKKGKGMNYTEEIVNCMEHIWKLYNSTVFWKCSFYLDKDKVEVEYREGEEAYQVLWHTS